MAAFMIQRTFLAALWPPDLSIYSLYIAALRFQDVCSHVGRVPGVLGQTGPLPPGANEEDERPHPGNQQVR